MLYRIQKGVLPFFENPTLVAGDCAMLEQESKKDSDSGAAILKGIFALVIGAVIGLALLQHHQNQQQESFRKQSEAQQEVANKIFSGVPPWRLNR